LAAGFFSLETGLTSVVVDRCRRLIRRSLLVRGRLSLIRGAGGSVGFGFVATKSNGIVQTDSPMKSVQNVVSLNHVILPKKNSPTGVER
jgi:hypothetical protein